MAFLATCRSRLLLNRLLMHPLLITHNPERTIMVRSKQFPEYSLLFDFERVTLASKFNRAKYMATILLACGTPTLAAVQAFSGMISPNIVGSFIFYGGFITVFLHSAGYLFNNAIGFIYVKDDNKSIKLSYVGFWGQRVDIDTTVNEICAPSDSASGFNNPWFQKVRLINSKTHYKMYITAGRILDTKVFDNIFGGVELERKIN
ncbi:transmembrane protein 186 [Venturia canescens]|uniref:transmembrane protein 186 n=1 Tax=Venturia canescens TaxID=32260 RepID=UPI001C9CFC0F|nr:transmembrane protein 186 [Venturia canescens]